MSKNDILLALKGEVSCAFCPKNDEGWALHLRTEVRSFRACTYKKKSPKKENRKQVISMKSDLKVQP